MNKIFNGNYTRLDDDTSFQLVRTNPILTTNTKLMYDGNNLYLESYDANPLLNTQRYKNFRVKRTSPFNMDIRNFLADTGDSAYDVFQKESDLSICDSYDKQFETMYWCGAESINSKQYPQELGFIAPLHIRKKLPNYFVIFKVDGPSNHNLTLNDKNDFKDTEFNLWKDIFEKAKIIKSFDLREGTPIGNYIKKYVEQSSFEYDRSIYVNFSTNEIVYYGIDKIYGVLTSKKENFKKELLENDNTIMHSDDWITSGYKRNGLIYPYIFNMEFLFDDDDTENYEFSRYFGMYCNDIDLYEFEARYEGETMTIEKPEEIVSSLIIKEPVEFVVDYDEELYGQDVIGNDKGKQFYYIKDKNNDLHQVSYIDTYGGDSDSDSENKDAIIIGVTDKVFDLSTVCGFEKTGVSTYCERVDTSYKSGKFSFGVNKNFKQGEQIRLWFGDMYKEFTAVTDEDENPIPAGQFEGTKFSAEGSVKDMVAALCGCINASYEDGLGLYQAVYDENMVVIKCISYIGYNHTDIRVEVDESLIINGRITVYDESQNVDEDFQKNGCVFKIKKDDMEMFLDDRYLKTIGENKLNSRILSCVPYVNENDEVESDYFELTTDERGINVNVSNTNMVEIIDRFYPKFGILSFFPVMDFDFDTVFSSYGIYQAFYNECVRLEEKSMENDTGDSDSEYERGKITTLAQGYLKDYGGKAIDTEYEYFMENFIPELCTQSKCTPYITKWGYYDNEKDSCENPYRLNMSKIFGTSNLSSNTFSNQYSINEHTHSMPYYLVKEIPDEVDNNMNYQYVKDNIGIFNWNTDLNSISMYNNCVNHCIELFEDTEVNNFDRLFTYKTENDKRFDKKYSRMKFGDENHFATTLFRGVKFNIKKVNEDDVEIEGADYNDYKFSFLYIPVELNSIFSSDNIYFVKNDTFKFIVGFILVNVFSNEAIDTKYGIDDFGKAYIYGGCYGLLNLPNIGDESDTGDSDGYCEVTLINIPINCLFEGITIDEYGWLKKQEGDEQVTIDNLTVINQSIRRMIDNLDDEHCIKSISIRVLGGLSQTYNVTKVSDNIIDIESPISMYIGRSDDLSGLLSKLVVDMVFNDRVNEDGISQMFKDFYGIYESLSTCAIKERLEDGDTIFYYPVDGDKYRMEIEDPISFNTYDIFMGNPYIVEESNENIPASSKITLKNNANDIVLKTINRYSGYYNPIFNQIIMFNDYLISGGSSDDSDGSDSEYSVKKEYEYEQIDKEYVGYGVQKVDSVLEHPSGDDYEYIYTEEFYKLVNSRIYEYRQTDPIDGAVYVDDVDVNPTEESEPYIYTKDNFYRRERLEYTGYRYEEMNFDERFNYEYRDSLPDPVTSSDPTYLYIFERFYKRKVLEHSYIEIDESQIDSSEEPTFIENKEELDKQNDEYVFLVTYYRRVIKDCSYKKIEKDEVPSDNYKRIGASDLEGTPYEDAVAYAINHNIHNMDDIWYYIYDEINTTFYKLDAIIYGYELETGGFAEGITLERVYDTDTNEWNPSDSDSDFNDCVYVVNAVYQLNEVIRYVRINKNELPEGSEVVNIFTDLTADEIHRGCYISDSYDNEYLHFMSKFFKRVETKVVEYEYVPINKSDVDDITNAEYYQSVPSVVTENSPLYIYLNEEYYRLNVIDNYRYEPINEHDVEGTPNEYSDLPIAGSGSANYVVIRRYYKLVEKEIIDDNDVPTHKYSNTSFDIDYKDFYGEFALIKNLWFHKVNEYYPDKIIRLMNPLYPAIGEFALDYRNYNIFESNWDNNYFTTQVDKKVTEMCAGTSGSLNKISMFGSKYLNVPEEITIDTFNRCVNWDDDFITRSKIILSDIMYKEVNGTSVSFYLFLYDRIVRYFARESGLRDVFEEYVNPEYSFGDKTTIEDDIKSYIEKNIMKLYYLDKIEMWVKEKKVGIHDSRIENNYKKFILIDNSVKVTKDMKKVNTFSIKKMTENQFDRCITYNLKKGCKEDFGFSFTIKKI